MDTWVLSTSKTARDKVKEIAKDIIPKSIQESWSSPGLMGEERRVEEVDDDFDEQFPFLMAGVSTTALGALIALVNSS